MLHAIRIFAVSSIRGTPAWLGISSPPGLRAQGPEERSGMKGARPHFQIIGLVDNAALLCPEVMQRENEILEGHNRPYRSGGSVE